MWERTHTLRHVSTAYLLLRRKETKEGPHSSRMLTVTSYLTLLPTSLSDRMALSPFTSPEKKSCWGMATLVVEEQEEGIKRPNGVRRVRPGKAVPKPGIRSGRGAHTSNTYPEMDSGNSMTT